MPLIQCLLERLRTQLRELAPDLPYVVMSIAYQCGDQIETCLVARQPNDSLPSVDDESRFLVMSITKSLTAVAVLRLVAAQTLELDAPLSQWLPELPHTAPFTIRHCLQHTSGLPDYGCLPAYHEAVRLRLCPWTFEEFLERTDATHLLNEPGQGWSYSNIGYMLLRRLLERAGKRSFAEMIAAEICRPLNLRHTSVVETAADLQTLIPGYSRYLPANDFPAVDVRDHYDP